MFGFPFDSRVTFDTDGTPIYDRAISSEPYRELLSKLFTTGVAMSDSTNLQVNAGTGMKVVVSPGFAIINGFMALEKGNRELVVNAAESQDRIDTVVVRLNTNSSGSGERTCDLYVRKGTAATVPVRPELSRTASIYEIGLADVFVAKNTTAISSARITDTRLESSRCGIISAVAHIDTTTLFNQYHEEFVAWFNTIRDILDASTAGHLQNEIDAISAKATALEGRISETEEALTEDINSRFEDSPVTFSASSTVTLQKFSAVRSGKIVSIVGEVKFKSTGSGWNSIGTITGKRPAVNTAGSALNNTSPARTPQGVFATTSGGLSVIGSFNANDIIDFSVTYMIS